MRDKIKGGIYGALSAFFYGTNPLFALPMYEKGIGVNSVLFYRYVIAGAILFIILKFFKKESLKITKRNFFELFLLGFLFSMSSLTLFSSFKYIDSGLACTILFIYPIIVGIIMSVFFKEKLNKNIIASIFLTGLGVCFLYNGKGGNINTTGIIIILISALTYALYIVGVKTLPSIKNFTSSKLSFYVMLFGLLPFLFNIKFGLALDSVVPLHLWANILGLSILPTVLSIGFLTKAINLIGSTPSAVLGALEPVTALFFGVTLFNEELTLKIAFGIFLILSAVLTVILGKDEKSL